MTTIPNTEQTAIQEWVGGYRDAYRYPPNNLEITAFAAGYQTGRAALQPVQQNKDAATHLAALDKSYYNVWKRDGDKRGYVAGNVPVESLVAVIEAYRAALQPVPAASVEPTERKRLAVILREMVEHGPHSGHGKEGCDIYKDEQPDGDIFIVRAAELIEADASHVVQPAPAASADVPKITVIGVGPGTGVAGLIAMLDADANTVAPTQPAKKDTQFKSSENSPSICEHCAENYRAHATVNKWCLTSVPVQVQGEPVAWQLTGNGEVTVVKRMAGSTAETPFFGIGYEVEPLYLATLQPEQVVLMQGIYDAAVAVGIIKDGTPLDGPQCLMLLTDLAKIAQSAQQVTLANKYVVCPGCHGRGEIDIAHGKTAVCKRCNGTCVNLTQAVRQEPLFDLKRMKAALASPSIQIVPGSDLESMRRQIIDAVWEPNDSVTVQGAQQPPNPLFHTGAVVIHERTGGEYTVLNIGEMKIDRTWIPSVTYRHNVTAEIYTRPQSAFAKLFELHRSAPEEST